MAMRGLPARERPSGSRASRGAALPSTPTAQRALLGAIALLLGTIAGCGGFFSMPDRLAETQAQVTDVQRRQEALAREVEALKAQIAAQEELLRAMRAEDASNSAELRSLIEMLRSQLDYTSRQIRRSEPRPSGRPARADTAAGRSARPDTAGGPALEEQGLYNAALQHLQQGRYPLAINGFREYLSKFPEGALGDAAQYGIAEAYYAQSDFPTAAIEFRALVDRYPGSDRLPAALLKAGLAYFEAGKEDLGRAYLERVVNEYPYSDEALRAKDRLDRWNKR